jgi:Na+/melibiose symporter-like transporter
MLVKKHYPKRQRKSRRRPWMLQVRLFVCLFVCLFAPNKQTNTAVCNTKTKQHSRSAAACL